MKKRTFIFKRKDIPGALEVTTVDDTKLCSISFCTHVELPKAHDDLSPFEGTVTTQLNAYFDGNRIAFDLPFVTGGTSFQKKCWEALTHIPYGSTCSYGEQAAAVGNSKASRAVGGANNRNPIPIVIPCHRVIGASGKLTGFAGGLNWKEFLLQLEKRCCEESLFHCAEGYIH